MIINGKRLMKLQPLDPMESEKQKANGVTWGLSEAGYDIRLRERLEFTPEARFKLASSIERFQMPSSLVGIVHDKSTWARKGLSVFNTVIEPGWEGYLTLELVYHGTEPLIIEAGSGIAQVLFHTLFESKRYTGRYQGQGPYPIEAKSI